MKRTVLLLSALLSIGLVCGTAHGSFDPNADSFGVYFTADALWIETHVAPFTPFDGYLILANPVSAVDGFECTVTPIGGSLLILSADLGPGTLDVDTSGERLHGGRSGPVPDPTRRDSTGALAVHGNDYRAGALPHRAGDDSLADGRSAGRDRRRRAAALRRVLGLGGHSVACINTSCTVSDAVTSFGAVKSLYR